MKLFGINLPNPFQKKEAKFDDEIAAFVDEEYKRRQTERKPFELQWRLNSEFINGNQYLDINTTTQTIEEIPKFNWWQEREVFNQMSTIVETRIARLTRQKPIMKVRPATNDDGDISSAKVSSLLCVSTWHDQNMDQLYNDKIAWLEHTGTVLYKTVWNPQKGRIVYQGNAPGQNDQPVADGEIKTESMDQQLGLNQQMTTIREGDIETTIVPSFEFFPDSSFRNGLRECRSVIHAKAHHIDEIEEIWGVRVEPEEVDVMSLQGLIGIGGLGYNSGQYRFASKRLKNHAVVKEYYEKPSKKYPQGRFIVSAGKRCLYVGAMPFRIGDDGEPDFPFVRIVSIDKPGVFWGQTIAERCIPIQRRYNALRNRKAEYLNLVSLGQWKIPIGSIEDDQMLDNSPGNLIYYRPVANGASPEPVQFPSLPASFENEIQTLLSEFTAISGISELSRYSEAPSGVKSGVALSIANEQDDTRLSKASSHIAVGVTQLGKIWIRLYRQFVQEPRILRSVGSNREVDVKEWTASDLKSDDIIIENSSALAETPSQRRQMIFDLLGAGLFTRPEMSSLDDEGRLKVFELLEFGHWETGFTDDLQLQKSRARRENQGIMQGIPAMKQDFDDDAEHVRIHNRMRMSAEYEQLLRTPAGPLIDKIMRDHVMQHMLSIAQNMQPQQPQQPK